MALEHAGAPHPVEEDGLEVFGILAGCRSAEPAPGFGFCAGAVVATGAAERRGDADAYPTDSSTNIHGE
jgi:hypothetical protein